MTRCRPARTRSRSQVRQIADGEFECAAVPMGEYRRFAEAVLRVGPGAYLACDAVLALLRLGPPQQPLRIRVGVPRRVRRTPPGDIEVITRAMPAHLLTRYHGIPSVTVAQAIIDCRDLVPQDCLLQALAEAVDRGLIDEASSADIRATVRLSPLAGPVRTFHRSPRFILGAARVTTPSTRWR